MADLSDVTNALGVLIGATLYPAGATGEASSPVAGAPVRVEVGWPAPQALEAALKAGKAHVSIFPRPSERNTTRFSDEWEEASHLAATYTLTKVGQQIAVGGTAPAPFRPQNLVVFLDGEPYVAQTVQGQTLAQIAVALRDAIRDNSHIDATAGGGVVTIPDDVSIGALRVGATGTLSRELARQEREFQITIWAPNPAIRDAVAKPVDLALRKVPFLTLPDGYAARLLYKGSPFSDAASKQDVWRRDLIYSVEYATTEAQDAADVTVITEAFEDAFDQPLTTVHV